MGPELQCRVLGFWASLRVFTWSLQNCALPPLRGSEVWALRLYRASRGYLRDAQLKGPCSDP